MRATRSCLVSPAGQVLYGLSITAASMCEGVHGSVPSSLRPIWLTTDDTSGNEFEHAAQVGDHVGGLLQ